ncbi:MULTISPECIES: restriction endonuclease [unclassified Streptomyces]|uniref:restriction endonuclease n=1 Tax=unclassified Streptomyces TaxID=2593676 RepID=UPI001660099D|nr:MULTISPECIES: restriction endonuclease [unclassified Streptomyces]MBD0712384.1 restriction endonuclease [Streptomyces sp. CBMA291]MBD0716758.1 restriction endonuclease [Streptomyces sp. CBMA370]
MSRRSGGLIGIWAEQQRLAQRQREGQQQAVLRQRREAERAQRAYERDVARMQREQRAAYRQQRDADALRRTRELDERVAALQGLLAAGCGAPPFAVDALRREESVEPFSPGPLAEPVPLPDQRRYQPQSAWTASGRAQAERDARARFEHDWYAAQAAEARRAEQLAAYRREYDTWAAARMAEIRTHNAGVAGTVAALREGEAETVVEFFSAVLFASTAWPEGFPREVSAAYDRGGRALVLDWELPGYEIVPEAKGVKYLPGTDQEKEVPRPVTQRRALYRDVLAQSVLLAVRELFAADRFGALETVVLNGYVGGVDPATGLDSRVCVATAGVGREVFDRLNLELVAAVDCLTGALSGRLSAKPDERTAVAPLRTPDQVGTEVVVQGDGEEPDLLAMDPIAFEGLVAELFRARGLQAVTTRRSNDGGVDVEALDPDPISGGSIVVQVKRYRNTVPPTAVRDLFGTVQGAGANKGVLVTTSKFGPGSYTFANGKPLTLIPGTELVDLLHQHGLRGRLGPGGGGGGHGGGRAGGVGGASGAGVVGDSGGTGGTGGGRRAGEGPGAYGDSGASPAPGAPGAGAVPATPSDEADDAFNLLGMVWSGDAVLDVCALVCAGNRVLGDEWFVFFNNQATPDGSVAMVTAPPGDRAAVRVGFDALPAGADRLVLVAAVDPEVNPDADLGGFTDAGIRLRDDSGTELDRLVVSDGRPGEKALVLGSFRRRSGGDWDFVLGGKGYRGGLEELVGDFGIDVE